MIENRIFHNIIYKDSIDFASACVRGDWENIDQILSMPPQNIVELIKDSGLKGRGGAGFPTGMKWSFLKKEKGQDAYLVINADESEPGTCKDREIIHYEPHKIIEGIVISAYALQVKSVYIYIRGEFYKEYLILQNAIEEAQKFINIDIAIHRGAGAYICGEETALLSSLEGNRGMPRLKPPFPAVAGLYSSPTIVNNIETIASVPAIVRNGSTWFNTLGVKGAEGTKLFCISGHVNQPCVVEEELGISLKLLIEKYAGGVIGGWSNLLAVIPGGSSSPLIPKSVCNSINMDFDSLKRVGSSLGTGGIIVMNKSTNIVKAIEKISYFYMHESCGQCTPCREGTGWLWRILHRISEKQYTSRDVEMLLEITDKILGNTICALGDAASLPIIGLLKNFKTLLLENSR
ncbi:MAG: NADH oxidoreductase (quinone), F subunit [Candidatus Xenolissoclinum pacificiensis L6]|uniref:NADH-quinone oxidoreductase subunit F n=1 Tax=Candidatus Xenolissoclinum pacificiensis L6 TaxID=1401685 RepID=W2UYE8_9RICK|nr:MAG: NADH oxidoreductase (quinone), F subunit [Candidatus Xenolissoclinum pacificiensis L6]